MPSRLCSGWRCARPIARKDLTTRTPSLTPFPKRSKKSIPCSLSVLSEMPGITDTSGCGRSSLFLLIQCRSSKNLALIGSPSEKLCVETSMLSSGRLLSGMRPILVGGCRFILIFNQYGLDFVPGHSKTKYIRYAIIFPYSLIHRFSH